MTFVQYDKKIKKRRQHQSNINIRKVRKQSVTLTLLMEKKAFLQTIIKYFARKKEKVS
jgi:hypothetical protein